MKGRTTLRLFQDIFLTGMIGLVFCFSPPLEAWVYRAIVPGLEHAVWPIDGESSGPRLHLLRVDLQRFEIRVIDAREFGRSADFVQNLAKQSKAIAVLNANFFDQNQRPLGLVLQHRQIKAPPRNVAWWAFVVSKGKQLRFIKSLSRQTLQRYEQGVQAGPRLVVQGSPMTLKQEVSLKSAIGIDAQGRAVLVASEGPVEINHLARLLAQKESEGGAGLKEALNLDGGASAQLFVQKGGFYLSLPGLSRVPIALGIFARHPAQTP